MIDLKQLVNQVIALTNEVGNFIDQEAKDFNRDRIEHKGFNDLVSYVDKEAEKALVSKLRSTLPEAGFITEEGTVSTTDAEYQWVIDPLDGTTNFTHGIPVFAISVALMKKNELLIGVILDITRKKCYYASAESAASGLARRRRPPAY